MLSLLIATFFTGTAFILYRKGYIWFHNEISHNKLEMGEATNLLKGIREYNDSLRSLQNSIIQSPELLAVYIEEDKNAAREKMDAFMAEITAQVDVDGFFLRLTADDRVIYSSREQDISPEGIMLSDDPGRIPDYRITRQMDEAFFIQFDTQNSRLRYKSNVNNVFILAKQANALFYYPFDSFNKFLLSNGYLPESRKITMLGYGILDHSREEFTPEIRRAVDTAWEENLGINRIIPINNDYVIAIPGEIRLDGPLIGYLAGSEQMQPDSEVVYMVFAVIFSTTLLIVFLLFNIRLEPGALARHSTKRILLHFFRYYLGSFVNKGSVAFNEITSGWGNRIERKVLGRANQNGLSEEQKNCLLFVLDRYWKCVKEIVEGPKSDWPVKKQAAYLSVKIEDFFALSQQIKPESKAEIASYDSLNDAQMPNPERVANVAKEEAAISPGSPEEVVREREVFINPEIVVKPDDLDAEKEKDNHKGEDKIKGGLIEISKSAQTGFLNPYGPPGKKEE